MATDARTTGAARYIVEVSGSWLDPMTQRQQPRIETFNVLALHPAAAKTAGMQLYGSAAAAHRCVAVGERSARLGTAA